MKEKFDPEFIKLLAHEILVELELIPDEPLEEEEDVNPDH